MDKVVEKRLVRRSGDMRSEKSGDGAKADNYVTHSPKLNIFHSSHLASLPFLSSFLPPTLPLEK
jgi:hypothetical protein